MLEKDGQWIEPGKVYAIYNPQLPDDGMKVNIHLIDGRVIPTTFKADGYDFFDEAGGRWNIANPGIRGWSI